MIIDAKQFHPMRGHMEDGAIVRFDSGRRLTLNQTMRGWTLSDDQGARVFGPAGSAHEVTAAIVKMDTA